MHFIESEVTFPLFLCDASFSVVSKTTLCIASIDLSGAYAGFLRGGGPNFKFFGILDIHAAERHVASSEAASLC